MRVAIPDHMLISTAPARPFRFIRVAPVLQRTCDATPASAATSTPTETMKSAALNVGTQRLGGLVAAAASLFLSAVTNLSWWFAETYLQPRKQCM